MCVCYAAVVCVNFTCCYVNGSAVYTSTARQIYHVHPCMNHTEIDKYIGELLITSLYLMSAYLIYPYMSILHN